MFEWNDKYAVGIARIDAQHKGLFSIGAELYAAMRAGQASDKLSLILNRLVQYTVAHFSYEEGLMKANRYPDFAAHKAKHDDLTRQVTKFCDEVQSGKIGVSIPLMKFLEDWLQQHIGKTDMAYAPFLAGKAA
jgi:hemerythrin-like metal-binding protein